MCAARRSLTQDELSADSQFVGINLIPCPSTSATSDMIASLSFATWDEIGIFPETLYFVDSIKGIPIILDYNTRCKTRSHPCAAFYFTHCKQTYVPLTGYMEYTLNIHFIVFLLLVSSLFNTVGRTTDIFYFNNTSCVNCTPHSNVTLLLLSWTSCKRINPPLL